MDFSKPHRRFNPLTQEWLLVSPQRATRPWLGQVEKPPATSKPAYDPTCYLCPGNARVGGARNDAYEGVFVFDNDFPALLAPSTTAAPQGPTGSAMLGAQQETGICRVICFSPRHDLTLPELPLPHIRAVVDTWVAQCEELGARPDIAYVQVFENKGEMMGASNPHPHGQLWATAHVPTEVAKETAGQRAWLAGGAVRPLLLDYVEHELREGVRLVASNAQFVAVVPFWAVWPFETMLLPRSHIRRMPELRADQRDGLADILKTVTGIYDRLFGISFPYTMGFHQAPFDDEPHEEWQLHVHFYPPLLRSATVKKFMVGYEMLAQPQRDLTAEQAAERLRSLA